MVQRKDKEFLSWAHSHSHGWTCCICRAITGACVPASELHHFGQGGMGMKGVDHLVAPVCRQHHEAIQGKYRSWFVMNDELETWTAMLESANSMLSQYIFHIKRATPDDDDNDDVF